MWLDQSGDSGLDRKRRQEPAAGADSKSKLSEVARACGELRREVEGGSAINSRGSSSPRRTRWLEAAKEIYSS
ncbi:hypothetical protein E2562_011355 [Oryza meyeriana var. granulata]|uniref:Uncharacterized protein n=1 Tax=Oryza meyeriana var. granulata TaxID=110450 RepID=A0A6G1BVF9_9ORYZ|nr:hypothetical protein E2562_011355 [Oryza meyeriana var. granulata]